MTGVVYKTKVNDTDSQESLSNLYLYEHYICGV